MSLTNEERVRQLLGVREGFESRSMSAESGREAGSRVAEGELVTEYSLPPSPPVFFMEGWLSGRKRRS